MTPSCPACGQRSATVRQRSSDIAGPRTIVVQTEYQCSCGRTFIRFTEEYQNHTWKDYDDE